MLYSKDFTVINSGKTKKDSDTKSEVFTVILEQRTKIEEAFLKYSLSGSFKPLSYFSAIFGTQIVGYKSNEVRQVKLLSKLNSLLVILIMFLIYTFVNPKSWRDTKSDVPLNILTKCFGYLSNTEVTYLIFIATIGNSGNYLKLLKKLDNFDQHFKPSKTLFLKGRVVAMSLILFSIVEVSFTFWLRKFNIHNIGAHLTLYSLILQGTVIVFFLGNIYSRLLVVNDLLLRRALKTLPSGRTIIFEDSLGDKLAKKIFSDSQILALKLRSHYNWFELMQMYDKTADCVYLFNKIYAGQVFFMFQTSLFCTMLTICRYLSPSLKTADYIVSDIYIYSCINIRPLFLAKMCALISDQKKKSLLMLLNVLVHGDLDDVYRDQIQTMINLVGTRKMEITANVFTADLPTVVNFSGRVVSYTVLMIQYFYMHVLSG